MRAFCKLQFCESQLFYEIGQRVNFEYFYKSLQLCQFWSGWNLVCTCLRHKSKWCKYFALIRSEFLALCSFLLEVINKFFFPVLIVKNVWNKSKIVLFYRFPSSETSSLGKFSYEDILLRGHFDQRHYDQGHFEMTNSLEISWMHTDIRRFLRGSAFPTIIAFTFWLIT